MLSKFPVSHRPLPPGKRNTCNAPATERAIELVLAAMFRFTSAMLREILHTRKLAVTMSMSNIVQHAANLTWAMASAQSNATWLMTLLAHQSRNLVK